MKIPVFFPASVIAQVLHCSPRTVRRLAKAKGWPARRRGARLEFTPPAETVVDCLKLATGETGPGLAEPWITPSLSADIFRTNLRFAALLALQNALNAGQPPERALVEVARDFTFRCSPSSLRAWQHRFAKQGLPGLMENRRGRSGRKPKSQT